MNKKYIDLGLPSGTLWADTNEDKAYNWHDAITSFPHNLPARWQFCELVDICQWEWDKIKHGYQVIGPNGSSIFLPASGRFYGGWRDAGSLGYYWSSTQFDNNHSYLMSFYSDFINPSNHNESNLCYCVRCCIRCIKHRTLK